MFRACYELLRRFEEEAIYYLIPNCAQDPYLLTITKTSVFDTGNQIGKTTAMVVKYLMFMMGVHPAQAMGWFPKPPIYARITCTSEDEGIEEIVEPILLGGKVDGIEGDGWCPKSWIKDYKKTKHKLTLKNGSVLKLMSQEQEVNKFAGKQLHLSGNDEPADEDIYNENFARLTRYNGCSDVVYTPDPKKGFTWVWRELIKKEGKDGIMVFRGATCDNKINLSEVGIKKFEAGLTSEIQRMTRWFGDHIALSGRVLESFSEKNKARALSPEQIKNLRYNLWARGFDLGMSTLFACLWAVLIKEKGLNVIHIVGEYGAKGTTIPANAEAMKMRFKGQYMFQSYIDPVTSQRRNPLTKETEQDAYIRYGIPCVPGVKSLDLGMSAVEELLKLHPKEKIPLLVIHDNCSNLINEMEEATWAEITDKKKWHYLSSLRWIAAARINEAVLRKIPGAIYDERANRIFENTDNDVKSPPIDWAAFNKIGEA